MSSKEMGIKLDADARESFNDRLSLSHSEISAYYSFVHLISTVGWDGVREPFAEQHYLQKYTYGRTVCRYEQMQMRG